MNSNDASERRERWARLRFAVVGPLLASPPPAGQLRAELERLAEREWEHPCGKGPVRFSASTIERWYYQARAADNDPVGALKRRPRAELAEKFPACDCATNLPTEDDTLWTEELEAPEATAERGYRFLQWLAQRPETDVAIVAHGGLFHYLVR